MGYSGSFAYKVVKKKKKKSDLKKEEERDRHVGDLLRSITEVGPAERGEVVTSLPGEVAGAA